MQDYRLYRCDAWLQLNTMISLNIKGSGRSRGINACNTNAGPYGSILMNKVALTVDLGINLSFVSVRSVVVVKLHDPAENMGLRGLEGYEGLQYRPRALPPLYI